MRKNVKIVMGAALAFAAGGVLAPITIANAGHTNSVLTTELDGRSEVATGAKNQRIVGDPNGTGEAYVFGVDGDLTTLCYVLTVDKIGAATAAHIHEGAPGANGPIVVNLAAPGDGNAADCLTEGEVGPGTTPKFPTGETVQAILQNPGDYYVNVHNPEYPGGAIRGQLSAER